ncbi:MAG: MFS transporter [Desulfobulbaceae bacterium]|nr:MFS transporter [Desulfobulbaceae bacterium]
MSDMTNSGQASWKPLIVIALSMVMMYITSFSVNVLISVIVTDLKTSVANLQFVIVSASLIAGSLMVTAGRLGDKFGKKKIFLLGVIIYTVGLTIVVLSPNIAIFTFAWGIIWPLGMVLIIPTSIAMIMYYYKGSQRATAFGIYGAVLSAVSAVAPVVVGALANELGWRIALALSPAAGVVTILFAFTLTETDKDSSVKIDAPSVILSVLAFGTFLITSTMAGQYGWFSQKRPLMLNGDAISLFGLSVVPFLYLVSLVLLIAFLWRGSQLLKRGETPMLDGALLKNIPFTLGMTVQALLYMTIAGVLFSVSVFLQAGVRFDSLQTALTMLPFSVLVAAFSFLTPGLAKWVAPKWIICVGCLVMAAGIWLTGNDASMQMKPMDLLPAMILLGAGGGLIMAQVATVTMSTVPAEMGGAASGVSETAKEIIGQGFAIALAGSVLFGAVYASMANDYSKLEGIQLSAAEHQEVVVQLEDTFQEITEEGENTFIASLPQKTREGFKQISINAAEHGLRTALGVMNVVVAIMLLLSLLLPAIKPDTATPEEQQAA